MPDFDYQKQQANAIPNPFEEQPVHVTSYTAKEIATLQSRLDKQLGPEYISSRPGAGGGKVHYIAAEKVINLANEVFGFNGWSSAIQNVHVDFVSEKDGKISLSCSVVCRVTLKDGTHHEDIGCGSIDNCRSKAQAFEKAKKEAATDALKRALRNFGNVLGNCLYDKDFLARVTKVKALPSRWDVENLHRHPDYISVKKEEPTSDRPNIPIEPPRTISADSLGTEYDDEFGGDLFDGVDLAHPDEVLLHDPHAADLQSNSTTTKSSTATEPVRHAHAVARVQSVPYLRQHSDPTKTSGSCQAHQQALQMRAPTSANHTTGQQRTTQNHSLVDPSPRHESSERLETASSLAAPQQHDQAQVVHKRPSHSTPDNLIQEPAPMQQDGGNTHQANPNIPVVGFVSGSKATLIQAVESPGAVGPATSNIPAFNPHADSPSIRRTVGIERGRSGAVRRDDINRIKTQAQQDSEGTKPATTIGGTDNIQNVPPPQPPPMQTRTDFINPQADSKRKIGMPGGGVTMQSPLANRGAYKPPRPANGNLPKRGPDGLVRPPLSDVSNIVTDREHDGGDEKRPRLAGRV